jgi:hypothetical protein
MGWIKHEGNWCPVSDETIVRVMLRDGSVDTDMACNFRWDAFGLAGDIMFYSTDEVCPDDVPATAEPLPGMSEREFVQQHYLAVLASGNTWSMPDAIKYGRLAYRAIDEALSEEAGE